MAIGLIAMSLIGLLGRGFGPTTGGGGTPPTAPTLAIADNANGTGGVATVSGADAGTTNTLQYQAVNGELGTTTWTTLGSRSGNGTISFSLAVGYYWFRIVSTNSDGAAQSNLVYAAITSGSAAIEYQVLQAVQSRIQGLSLSGIASSSIVIRKVDLDRDVTKPAILLVPLREAMPPNAGTNERDDVTYSVLVAMYRAGNQDLTSNIASFLLWREKVAKAFRNQRLPGATSVYRVWVEPGEKYLSAAFRNQYDVQALVIRALSRETRGIT